VVFKFVDRRKRLAQVWPANQIHLDGLTRKPPRSFFEKWTGHDSLTKQNIQKNQKSGKSKGQLLEHHCGADTQSTAAAATMTPVHVDLAPDDAGNYSVATVRIFAG